MKRYLGIAGVTVGALVLLLALLLKSGVSLGFITPYLERQASGFLQRPLHLNEPPHIQMDQGLRITLRDVSIDNADWAGDQALLQASDLTIRIDFASLFSRPIVIEDLLLDGLQVHLVTNSDGRSNLPEFARGTADAQEPSDPDRTMPFALKHARISNVDINRVNQATAQNLRLVIDTLSQEAINEDHLTLQGQGSLQDKPWTLSADASGIASLRSGKDISATIEGALGELTLNGNFVLPDMQNLANLTLEAVIDGPVPDRVAALSPLLVADEPAQVQLKVTDIDPGLKIDLNVDLTHLKVKALGGVDRPGSGDGLDLELTVDAASLPRLTQALGLGETPDIPLLLETQVARDGKRIELRNLKISAGAHQIEGKLLVPEFPNTTSATLDFTATGPDFAFYQKLLAQTPNLTVPYLIDGHIKSGGTAGETLTASADIGEHRLQLSGLLNNYPSYRGSDLSFSFNSPSLRTLAQTVDVDLPDSPVTLTGQIAVSESEMITLSDVHAEVMGLSAGLTGGLKSYPDFDNLDFRLTAEAASLRKFTQQFTESSQLPGDVPLRFAINVRGDLKNPIVSNPQFSAGGLHIQSSDGDLRITQDGLHSDLRLRVEISELPQLLGDYAPEGLPGARYSFALLPRLSQDTVGLSIEDFRGPGVTGTGRLELSRDFRINEKSVFDADMQLDDLSQLLPSLTAYAPPTSPLNLRAETRPQDKGIHIKAQLSGADAVLLSGALKIPEAASQQHPELLLSGAGPDLRRLGTFTALPDQALPYSLDLTADILAAGVSINARRFELAGTQIEGVASWDSTQQALSADLRVPNADLQRWLSDDTAAESATTKTPRKSKTDRMIPDVSLPVALLKQYRTDIALVTGPLGLSDPVFAKQSLVDMLQLQLSSGDGKAMLRIEELRGSRGLLTGNITAIDRDGVAEFTSSLQLGDFPLGFIAPVTVLAKLPLHDFTADFTARGNTVRELAATLDGDFLLSGGPGSLEKMSTSFATESFTAQLFQTLLPMLKTSNPDMQVECTVLAARAKQGVLTLDPGFVFRSATLDLSARGQIDLSSEKLKITFNNRVRDGLGLSAASLITPYLEISGTLSRPKLGLDIASSALNSGAAVASGGVTILARPLLERLLPKTNPCKVALASWDARGN